MSVHKVVYKGLSDIREMSAKDLKAAGVGMEKTLRWDKTTHGSLPAVYVGDISDRLLEIFKLEGTFTVTEVDEATMRELDVEPIMDGQPLDDTGSIVRDGTTGQTSVKGGADANADPVPGTSAPTGRTGRGSSTRGGTGSTGAGTGSST